MDDLFLIAEIIDIQSSDGTVIIKSFSDFPERFLNLEKVTIDFFGKKRELEVEFSKRIDDNISLKFRRFNSEEDASFLVGKKLFVDKHDLVSLPEDTYYIHDLIGCDTFIDNLFFGKLIDVLKLPGNDLYLVKKSNGKEVMIPAAVTYVRKIDIDEKKIFFTDECKNLDEDKN